VGRDFLDTLGVIHSELPRGGSGVGRKPYKSADEKLQVVLSVLRRRRPRWRQPVAWR
jgi:hypothetical protein